MAELNGIAQTLTGGAGTDSISITNAMDDTALTSGTITGFEAVIVDSEVANKDLTIYAGMFSTGAATFNNGGSSDNDGNLLVVTKDSGGTDWDASAVGSAALVAAAGDWHFDAAVGSDSVLTYYNETTSGVTTLTITGGGYALVRTSGTLLTGTL